MAEPRTVRRNRAGEATRRRIMQAAMTLVADEGYSALTIARVAAEAGVTVSSVRNLFDTKDQILAQAMEASLDDWRVTAPTRSPDDRSQSPEERIQARLGRAMEIARQSEADWWRVGMIVSLLEPSADLTAQRVFARVFRETGLDIWEWWQSMVPTEVTAQPVMMNALTQGYLSITNGMFIALRADPSLPVQTMVDLVASGLTGLVADWSQDADAIAERLREPERNVGSTAAVVPSVRQTVRDRLIDAAATIAAQRGYRGATLEAISERAGLPAGAPYREFQGKADLFEQVIQASIDARWSQTDRVPIGTEWPQAMESWLTGTSNSVDPQSRHFQRIGFMLVLERSEDGLPARNRYLSVRRQAVDRTAERFAAALPVHCTSTGLDLDRLLAEVMVVLSDGFLFGRLVDPGGWTIAAYRAFTGGLLEATVRAASDPGAK